MFLDLSIPGLGTHWTDLDPQQRMGRTLGRLEGQQVWGNQDRDHGTDCSVNLQEAQQIQQGT